MSVWISVLFCVLGNSHQCYRWVPPGPPVVGLAACAIQGEVRAAGYLNDHHGLFVSKVMCSPGNKPVSEDET